MRTRPKRCQKKGDDLPPSVIFTRDPLNAYDYRAVPESLTAIIRLANSANVWRLRTSGRLYPCNAILERLPPYRQPVAWARGPLIEAQEAVVRQRHLTRHGNMPAADQPHRRGGVRRGATRVQGIITV